MSSRRDPPKHQNKYAWKPKSGCKINETEPGGRFRPLSEITGVCHRCKEQIEWKRKYGKYKQLTEPAKCQRCSKRTVRQAYHNLCAACAKEHKVCAKCSCRVDQIVGRDISEVEAEKKTLEDAIKNARERDRRSLLRAMNKGSKTRDSTKTPSYNENKAGDLFQASSLEEYAQFNRRNKGDDSDNNEDRENGDTEDDESDNNEKNENEDNKDDDNFAEEDNFILEDEDHGYSEEITNKVVS